MAEAIALLGVAAAGLQCAQVGVQLLILGASLRSKLQDAPEKVQRWLAQIEQLVKLAELMRQVDLDNLTSPALQQPSNMSASTSSAISSLAISTPAPSTPATSSAAQPPAAVSLSWVAAVLRDCTIQAEALQTILKSMLDEVDSGRRQKLWKSVLTIKRETAIISALEEIERQKSMLNTWLGQQNLQHLEHLVRTIEDVGEGVKQVNQSMLDLGGSLHDETRTLSHYVTGSVMDLGDGVKQVNQSVLAVKESIHEESRSILHAVNSNTTTITSELQISRTAEGLNVAFLGEKMQQNHGDYILEAREMRLQLQSMTREMREMKAMKHEIRRLAANQARMGRAPSLLKETLQKQSDSSPPSMLPFGLMHQRIPKHSVAVAPRTCSCRLRTRRICLSVNASFQVSLKSYYSGSNVCPVHRNISSRFASIRCHVQSFILNNLVKLSFEATHGAGGFSMGAMVKTFNRVRRHSLESYFHDLYYIPKTLQSASPSSGSKDFARIVGNVQRHLDHAFRSGLASPNDIDSAGRTLIHVQFEGGVFFGYDESICEAIVSLLIAMGARKDVGDDRLISIVSPKLAGRNFAANEVEGRGRVLDEIIEVAAVSHQWAKLLRLPRVFALMRRWPNLGEYFDCPFVCDILVRKSERDLQRFIHNGMKGAGHNSRLLTPLHLAAAAGWPEGLRLLLAAGSDKFAEDCQHQLPIDYALESRCGESVLLLLEGDCSGYFTVTRMQPEDSRSKRMLKEFLSSSDGIQTALVNALTSSRLPETDLNIYHAIARCSQVCPNEAMLARKLYLAGFTDLEIRDRFGMTALMVACEGFRIDMIKFLLEKGAKVSSDHSSTGLTAGHFFSNTYWYDRSWQPGDSLIYAMVLQPAFMGAKSIQSYCRCSPEGFTPVTALIRSNSSRGRSYFFKAIVSSMKWSKPLLEEHVRAFALKEVFNGLELTHTCLDITNLLWSIQDEDRIEIEFEEQELHEQLQDLMMIYDKGREEFEGEPLDYLDAFLRMHELNLPGVTQAYASRFASNTRFGILDPGRLRYQSLRYSFLGEKLYFGHEETVKEENVLALLFGEDHLML